MPNKPKNVKKYEQRHIYTNDFESVMDEQPYKELPLVNTVVSSYRRKSEVSGNAGRGPLWFVPEGAQSAWNLSPGLYKGQSLLISTPWRAIGAETIISDTLE